MSYACIWLELAHCSDTVHTRKGKLIHFLFVEGDNGVLLWTWQDRGLGVFPHCSVWKNRARTCHCQKCQALQHTRAHTVKFWFSPSPCKRWSAARQQRCSALFVQRDPCLLFTQWGHFHNLNSGLFLPVLLLPKAVSRGLRVALLLFIRI